MRRRLLQIALLSALPLVWAASAPAATLVPVGGFERPIFVTSAPGDADRLLVAEREGRVVQVSGSSRTVFADLGTLVQCCEGERGLLSIAPAPDFASSDRLYVAYTGTAAAGGAVGDVHVDSFRHAADGVLLREPVLTIPHADFATHNGGQLQLGPDGFLYVSTGDGGGAGDPLENGQDLESLLGKLLRIDPRPGEIPPYAIPAANPFAGVAGADEVWAYGFRNPWRFSFDRLGGRLVVADVGQTRREEVDIGVAGANYGWNCREGFIAYVNAPLSCPGAGGFTDPVFDYPHEDPGGGGAFGCSITGGYVVRDPALPDLYGRYLYADFCRGDLRSLLLPTGSTGLAGGDRWEGLTVEKPVSFGEDAAGRVYVIALAGEIYRLAGGSPPPPAGPAGPEPPPPVRALVVLHARAAGGRGVNMVVRVLPCPGQQGKIVQLNRNGRFFRSKRLDARCVARFRVRRVRARYRAFFEGQRSQVRTIALAKPRP